MDIGFNCWFGKTREEITKYVCWARVADFKVSEILYIKFKKYKETEKHIEELVSIINEITECKIIKNEEDVIITILVKYTYNKMLILLNCIRNLWYNPDKPGLKYIETFFSTLKEKGDDPMDRLTNANKIACEAAKVNYSPGHCNLHKFTTLKKRTLKDFEEAIDDKSFNWTNKFLTNNFNTK